MFRPIHRHLMSFRHAARIVVAAGLLASQLGTAGAATATANFNVTATLTSVCTVSTPSAVAFTYTSFQAGPATATGGAFSVTCTGNLPYSLAVSAASGTVIGLAYTLSVPSGTQTGSGLAQSYTIGGSMIAGQAGTCATSATPCTGTNTHTLTVTY